MKRIALAASFVFAILSTANAQIKMPAASSTQTIVQEFGMGKIELTYSRPNIKGRALFQTNSELVPLGKVWRTGANSVTKIKFTDAVMLGGKNVDTGTYAIWTIPGKKDWTFILNKDSKNWGTQYVEADDYLRITVPADAMKESMETFTMQFANIKPESCELHLMWGNTAVRIAITTNIKDRIRQQVETALSADNVNPNLYFTAANFYYDLDKNYLKALNAASKATEANPKAFYMFILKAKIEKELGDKTAAKADAEKCIALATEQKNEDYVRTAKEFIHNL